MMDMEYVYEEGGELRHRFSGEGLVLYMWQAFRAGRELV